LILPSAFLPGFLRRRANSVHFFTSLGLFAWIHPMYTYLQHLIDSFAAIR
jgi:hypothetical protein